MSSPAVMKNQSRVAVGSVRRSARTSVRRGKKPPAKPVASGSKVSVRRGAKAKKETEGKATKESKAAAKPTQTKTKSKEERQARRVLEPGNAIASPNHKYTVVKLLGSGGFGDVYKVEDEETHVKLALKTEFYGSKMPRLKIEAFVLEKCSLAPTEKRGHFLTLRDKGTTEDFKFMCMEVVGPSLESVRKTCGSDFSKGTAFNITKQTLQAIWDLHALGFLHRDIKPANFSIGLSPDDETRIYILDFGIAREYKTSSGEIRNPRPKVPFCGTPRYAARACHKKEEQSPKDDLEIWCYMVFDVFDYTSLPWKKDSDREKILKKKEELMMGTKSPTRKCPRDFLRIVKYVNELNYIDVPDYRWIMDLLDEMVKESKVDASNEALDWVGKIKNEKDEKDEEVSYEQTGEDHQEDEEAANKPKPAEGSN